MKLKTAREKFEIEPIIESLKDKDGNVDVQQVSHYIASTFQERINSLVEKAITSYLGEGWTQEELEGRCSHNENPITGITTYFLDKRPILHISRQTNYPEVQTGKTFFVLKYNYYIVPS